MSYEQKVVIGSLAVLVVLGISMILALNLKGSPQGGTAGRPVHPEPLVTLPPGDVKLLISLGVTDVVLVQENDDIKQVIALFPDGRCEAGIPIVEKARLQVVEKAPVQGGLPTSPEFGLGVVEPPARALRCDDDCYCGSPNCRDKLGSCQPC